MDGSIYISNRDQHLIAKLLLDLPKNLQPSGSARPVKTNFSSLNEATASPQQDKTTFSSPWIKS